MRYIGSKIIEITEKPKDFTPHRMLCWESSPNHALAEYVIAIVKRSDDILFITDHSVWTHGAEIPEKPESRRVTKRELAKWLANGNGEYSPDKSEHSYTYAAYHYYRCEHNVPVDSDVLVRKWDDTAWHEPTAAYLGLPEDAP